MYNEAVGVDKINHAFICIFPKHTSNMIRKAVQRHRVNRVINFIHANSHHDIDLHSLADIACLSKYHFIRVFDMHVGQTPLRYLNRIRLERAARQLIFMPNTTVGKIAAGCGFVSHQSFTRSFSRHFDYAPQDNRKLDLIQDPSIPISASNEVTENMVVRVERRPATRIAYIRYFGSYRRDGDGICQAGALIRDWAESNGLDSSRPLIGLCPDNRRITPAHYCMYDIGIPVNRDTCDDDIVSTLTIPSGKYAIAEVHCRNEQLISAWDWLCSTWRTSRTIPYQQRWNYEVFPDSGDGSLNPKRGVHICLRLSI